jgi:hypothetical protein
MAMLYHLTRIRLLDSLALNGMHVHGKVLLEVITSALHSTVALSCYFSLRDRGHWLIFGVA